MFQRLHLTAFIALWMLAPAPVSADCKLTHPHHCVGDAAGAIFGGTKKRARMIWDDPIGTAINPIKIIDPSIPSPMSYVEYLAKNPEELVNVATNPTAGVVGLPFAIAISDGRNTALKSGVRRMPANAQAAMAPYFTDDLLDSVRFATGNSLSDGILQGIALSVHASAITLVNVVVFKNDRPENSPANMSLWAHELFHVDQYREMGLAEFAATYTLRPTQSGNIERPAYDFGRHYRNMMAKRVITTDMIMGLNGKCLTASRDSRAEPVVLETCDATNTRQRWVPTLAGELRTRSDNCLDVRGGLRENRTPLQVWNCNGTMAQKFTRSTRGELRTALRNDACVEVAGGQTRDGTPIQIFNCNRTASQSWQSVLATLIATRDNRCLRTDLFRQGSAVRLADCNKADRAQHWGVVRNNGPLHMLAAQNKCLDVTGGSRSNRTRVQLFECNGTRAQAFRFTRQRELRAALGSSICLDVPGGRTATRDPIHIFECNGSAAQIWNLP